MKKALKYIALAAVVAFGASSCDKFPDRPSEDSFTTAQFYQKIAVQEVDITVGNGRSSYLPLWMIDFVV